jgi:hypothetical protein
MISFHGDQKIKDKYVERMRAHIDADNLIRGEGWTGTKGCAVGCTLERYDHAAYETEIGLPRWIAKLEDRLFERMNLEKSKTFPLIFLESIPLGVDCGKALIPFLICICESALSSTKNNKSTAVIQGVLEQLRKPKLNLSALKNAQTAAYAAAYPAAYPAEAAAYAFAYAAYPAAYAAADAAARRNKYDFFADQLIRILSELK